VGFVEWLVDLSCISGALGQGNSRVIDQMILQTLQMTMIFDLGEDVHGFLFVLQSSY
jgi:hypothetical protein